MADFLIVGHPPRELWSLDAGTASEVRWILSEVINPARNKKR